MSEREGEFEFDFAGKTVEKLDDPKKRRPQGLQLVDFVLEEADRFVMIEVKDPSCRPKGSNPSAMADMEKERKKFQTQLQNNELITQELTPKARDSYTYLHLMERDGKPIVYVFLLGADKLPQDPALLLGFKERLLANLRQETDKPWSRQYVTDCVVLTEKTWSQAFDSYTMHRV